MTEVEKLAKFVTTARYAQISSRAVEQLKIRVLDTLGVAIGALDAGPTRAIRKLTQSFGETGGATLIGGGHTAPDRAAFYNTALSRYLDFMDSYLAPGETCHPSDNIGSVLAAAESVDATGKEFLTAVAIAYQVQTRLSDVAPVRAKGFDHTVQGAYAVPAGAAKALRLDAAQTANAIAISGTANNALRVTRTGDLSNWKGLAYPQVGKEGTFAALLARAGITGPAQVFEGNKGFKESIAGPFAIDWSNEDLESVLRTVVKRYDAEVHSQATLEAAMKLTREPAFRADAIQSIKVKTFQVAFDIIGGGEEGDKRHIRTKEEADHSLPYMVAVALLDRQVLPAQYTPDRITRDDVQTLLTKVSIAPDDTFSARFPHEMPTEVTVDLHDGTRITATANSFPGFTTQPLDWAVACAKFHSLVMPFLDDAAAHRIADCVHELDSRQIRELTALLGKVPLTRRRDAAVQVA